MYKAWGVKLPDDNPQAIAMRRQQEQMDKLMGSMDDVPVLKFGDASVAAPFTSKLGSIASGKVHQFYNDLTLCKSVQDCPSR
jgi:cation-transporting ATPase 13A1